MNDDSRPGSEQGGGGKEEGISALGRKVAGLDVGSKGHWVCAPAGDGKEREVKVFGATTPELEKMAEEAQAARERMENQGGSPTN